MAVYAKNLGNEPIDELLSPGANCALKEAVAAHIETSYKANPDYLAHDQLTTFSPATGARTLTEENPGQLVDNIFIDTGNPGGAANGHYMLGKVTSIFYG